jgi:hypothetical protein
MNSEQRIEALEDTVKVLKNEINTVLLDIREHYLDIENPFNQCHQFVPEPTDSTDVSEGTVEESIEPLGDDSLQKEEESSEPETFQDISGPELEITENHKPGFMKKMDWVTVVGLTQWAERATLNLGKAKAEAMVEVYYATGCLSDSFRELLIKLIRICEADVYKGHVTSKDYLSILVQLENILNGDGQREAALISILSDGEGLQ